MRSERFEKARIFQLGGEQLDSENGSQEGSRALRDPTNNGASDFGLWTTDESGGLS